MTEKKELTFREQIDKTHARMAIDLNCLTEEMAKQPSLFDTLAVKAAVAEGKLRRMQSDIKILEAQTQLRIREQLDNEGVKYTEGVVTAKAKSDAGYIAANNALNEAMDIHLVLSAQVEAMRQRAEMLVSAGADRRVEKKRFSNNEEA